MDLPLECALSWLTHTPTRALCSASALMPYRLHRLWHLHTPVNYIQRRPEAKVRDLLQLSRSSDHLVCVCVCVCARARVCVLWTAPSTLPVITILWL